MPPESNGAETPSVSVSDNAGSNNQQQQQQSNSGANANAGGTDFLAGLTPENKEFYEKTGWKDLNAAFASHRELQKTFSARGNNNQQQPNGGADVPPNPIGYEFKLPDNLPKDFAYNKDFATNFQAVAHNAQLTRQQAASLHDWFVNTSLEGFTSQKAESTQGLNKAVQTAHNQLVEAWGEKDTPAFSRNLEMSKRAIKNLDPGLKDALVELGAVRRVGGEDVVTNAAVMKALAKAGSALFSEDELYGSQVKAENPFDPKKPNYTKQGELIKTDPEMARTLIHAAGVADTWGHFLNRK
jgi:hypothetical protein